LVGENNFDISIVIFVLFFFTYVGAYIFLSLNLSVMATKIRIVTTFVIVELQIIFHV